MRLHDRSCALQAAAPVPECHVGDFHYTSFLPLHSHLRLIRPIREYIWVFFQRFPAAFLPLRSPLCIRQVAEIVHDRA